VLSNQPIGDSKFSLNHGEAPARSDKLACSPVPIIFFSQCRVTSVFGSDFRDVTSLALGMEEITGLEMQHLIQTPNNLINQHPSLCI
jgi:hypothetical protein